jgi:hypothetical protein
LSSKHKRITITRFDLVKKKVGHFNEVRLSSRKLLMMEADFREKAKIEETIFCCPG